MNLATATLPALALGSDPADRDNMKRPPVRASTLFEKPLIRAVAVQGILTAALTAAAYWAGASMSSHEAGQTMAFAVLALSQLIRSFTLSAAGFANRWLTAAAAASAALMAAILLVPSMQAAFRTTSLTAEEWLLSAALALLSAVPGELEKRRKK